MVNEGNDEQVIQDRELKKTKKIAPLSRPKYICKLHFSCLFISKINSRLLKVTWTRQKVSQRARNEDTPMAQERTAPFPKTTSNSEKKNPGTLRKVNFEENSRAILQRRNADLKKMNPDRRPSILATGKNVCISRTAILAEAHSLKKQVCLRVLEKDSSRSTRRFLKLSHCLARQVLHRPRASLMKQKGKRAGPQKDKNRVVSYSTEAKKSMQTPVGSFKCLLCPNAYNCTSGLAAHGRRKHSGDDCFKQKCGMILGTVGRAWNHMHTCKSNRGKKSGSGREIRRET
jgi:hypothetical protein